MHTVSLQMISKVCTILGGDDEKENYFAEDQLNPCTTHYLQNERFFVTDHAKTCLFHEKSAKFTIFFCSLSKFKITSPDISKIHNLFSKYNHFLGLIIFKCTILFCINKLLFLQTSVRFTIVSN